MGSTRRRRFPRGTAAWPCGVCEDAGPCVPWQKICDFCERLYGHLTCDVYYQNALGELELERSRSAAQEYITAELQQLFLEENLAFEFSGGIARRRGRRNTTDQIARGEFVLNDHRLGKAREHYNKALRFFRNATQPDYDRHNFCLPTAPAHDGPRGSASAVCLPSLFPLCQLALSDETTNPSRTYLPRVSSSCRPSACE